MNTLHPTYFNKKTQIHFENIISYNKIIRNKSTFNTAIINFVEKCFNDYYKDIIIGKKYTNSIVNYLTFVKRSIFNLVINNIKNEPYKNYIELDFKTIHDTYEDIKPRSIWNINNIFNDSKAIKYKIILPSIINIRKYNEHNNNK